MTIEERLDKLERSFNGLLMLMLDLNSRVDERIYDLVQARIMKEMADAKHCDTYEQTGVSEDPNRETIWQWYPDYSGKRCLP